MALLQSIHLEHLPASHVLHVTLFRSVSNAAFLQQQLLDGNSEFEYAFIDASVVRVANSFGLFVPITWIFIRPMS